MMTPEYAEMPKEHTALGPLTWPQRVGLGLLMLLFVGFGSMVELRGAFQHTRKTDAGVYMRAAWAVRTGNDPYSITDDRGWHYAYPPLLAILMAPMADPPHSVAREGYIPYEVSIGLWYVLTLGMGLAGIHILAKALEDTSPDPSVREQPAFCRRWWALRVLPVLIMLPAMGQSQARGQVGLPIAMLLCCAAASLLRGRRFRAGLWLSAAICIKLIPAFLLLLPAWRRDWRMLLGSLTGLTIGIVIIPVVALGPVRTLDAYRDFYNGIIVAGATGDTKSVRAKELTGIASTDSSSPMVVIHNIMYPEKATRPTAASPITRAAHWLISIALTAVTLFAAGWKGSGRLSGRIETAPREIVFFGALLLIMLISSPVFHTHYVSMVVPLVVALMSMMWDNYSYAKTPLRWKAVFLLLFASLAVTSIDQGIFLLLRDTGLVLLTTLVLLFGCVFVLYGTRGPFYAAGDYDGGHAV
jgi:alpha-1,2-mannosyltransferase